MAETVQFSTQVDKCPTCGADALDRSEFWEASPPNGSELENKVNQIERAIKKYYLALDNREHGGIAQHKAFEEIEQVLNMNWEQGKLKAHLDKHPNLKPFYQFNK